MSRTLKKISLYALLFYTLAGFILLPFILKSKLISTFEEQIEAQLSIEQLSFNPFLFKLSLDNLQIISLKNEPLFSLKSFCVNVDPSSLLFGALHLKRLALDTPVVHLVYNKDKSINLLSILKKGENTQKEEQSEERASKPMRIIADTIVLTDGALHYKDYTQKNLFAFSFEKIGCKVSDIDTKESDSTVGSVRLYSTLGDGGFIDFKSTIESYAPLKAAGTLDFEASKLYTEWKYLKERLKLEVADGKISFHTNYALNLEDINATRMDNLRLSLQNLRVKPKDKAEDILRLEELYVENATILPLMQKVRVPKLALRALDVKAKRYKNGLIDWIEYTKSDSNESEKKQETKAWDLLLSEVDLERISLSFRDAMVEPRVDSEIENLNIFMRDVTLLGEEPFSYKIDMLLNKKAKLSSRGEIAHKNLHISALTTLEGFDIVHYRPYIESQARKTLAKYDLDLESLELGFRLKSEMREENKELQILVSDANLSLEKLRLDKKSTQERLVEFDSLQIEGVKLDTQRRDVEIASLFLNALQVNAQKYKNKKFNFDALVVPKEEKRAKKSPKDEKGFSLQLKHFALRDMGVKFRDNSLGQPSKSQLDRINVDVYDIKNQKKSWLKYKTSLRVNKKGTIKTEGRLTHTPLVQKGSFELKHISLSEITPYLQESMYLKIEDGDISMKGKTAYSHSSSKPDFRVESSFDLNSLFVHDSRDDALLLSLSEIKTPSFTFELSPDRLYVNELDVNAFYVNAMIDKKKQLNFSKLMKRRKGEKKSHKEEKAKQEKKPFPLQIVKVNVAMGSANFADYSIPIKFKTDIHNLNGVIYSITNEPDETTYVNITGEVDEYGSTRLSGSVDSAKPKEFTDLTFSFKNLEMNSLSGYSASFAGHEIDSGKLYLDLDYDILHSQMKGSNTVIMKKVVLGKEREDENITVLPLGFVFGLLEDSDGVIDIDLEVEGDVDAPDFKYGPLVLKTVTGLITKAVTSPFMFLGSVMGFDGEKLSYLDFEAGASIITPPEREKLDQIAKIMLKKPKISLTVTTSYDTVVDKKALQLTKLIDRVMQKSGLKNRQEHESVMSIELLEEIYEDMREDDALDILREKLEEEADEKSFERLYQAKLIELCRSIQEVSQGELEALAQARAEAIVLYLNLEKFISKSRIIKAEPIQSDSEDAKLVRSKMQIEVK